MAVQRLVHRGMPSEMLHFAGGAAGCIVSACAFPEVYLTTSAMAGFIYVADVLFLLLCLGVKLGLAH
jgi:hypothetical protein